MERIKESGKYTGTITHAEQKLFHDNASGVLIKMDVSGKLLEFILVITRCNGSSYYEHKGESHLLPSVRIMKKMEEIIGHKFEIFEGCYINLIGHDITVGIETSVHRIKRHEFYTNEVLSVGRVA